MFVKPDEDWRPHEAIPTLLEALRRLGEAGGAATPPPDVFAQFKQAGERLGGADSGLYGTLRDGLKRLEAESKRHAEFVDRLVQPPKEAPKAALVAPYQETLYLQGAANGRTGGRFRALNRRDKRVSVATLSRPFTLRGEPAVEAPALTLKPGAFYLAPGEARLVSVEAELAGPGRYESCLDLTMDDAVALKLWIEIDVYS